MKLLLTTVPEGTCLMTMMWGKSKPRFILAYKGHHLDRHNNVVRTADWADDDPRWESMGIQIPSPADQLLIDAGLYPIGFPPRMVVSWEQTWAEWTHRGEGDKTTEERRLWVRSERTSRFMVKNFAYAFRLKEVETSIGIKVDIDFTVFVDGVNPEIALARLDDWFFKFEGKVRDRVRNYIGAKDLFELLSEEDKAKGLRKIMHPMQAIKAKKEAELVAKGGTLPVAEDIGRFNKYLVATTVLVEGEEKPIAEGMGLKITDASIDGFGLSPSEKHLLELMSSTTAQGFKNANIESEAEAKKRAAVTAGEGEAEAMKLVTAARVERWEKVDQAISGSPNGVALATVQAQAAAAIRVEELRTEAMTKVATAVEKNQKLTTVVFPGGSAQPVVPVGEKVS